MKRYQFKITLLGVRPIIWRRVVVPDCYTLAQFHDAIQAAMGWENYHLYSFSNWFQTYENQSGLSAPLNTLRLSVKSKLNYIYDFGDSWEHGVVLEKILPEDNKTVEPICLAGKRACPPEDCGGIWGYQEKLAVLSVKDTPEYEELIEWLGESFEPDRFDLKEANSRLKELAKERISHE